MQANRKTLIKICGLTQEHDVQIACDLGVDFVGFNQYAQSPRYTPPSRLPALLAQLTSEVQPVLLFVQPRADEVSEAVRACLRHGRLPILQFHGDEPAAECLARREMDGHTLPYWAVARIAQKAAASESELIEYAASHPLASALLLDTLSANFGGSGKVFDWTAINWLQLEQSVRHHLVLSGGLTAANVAEALRLVRPWALDVSSGVERSRGIKDTRKMVEFVAAVRAADALQEKAPRQLL